MFEYRIETFECPAYERMNKLSNIGKDGWELIQVVCNSRTSKDEWIFKRDNTKTSTIKL